jgi:hypothetical protein
MALKIEGPLPEGVKKRVDGVAVYGVEEDAMLRQGRDKHWEVMSQSEESAVGTDDEDEEDEAIARLNYLAALRGDWLPAEGDSDGCYFDCLEDAEDDEDDCEVSDSQHALLHPGSDYRQSAQTCKHCKARQRRLD